MLPRCASGVNVHPVRMCILSKCASPENASPESASPEVYPPKVHPPKVHSPKVHPLKVYPARKYISQKCIHADYVEYRYYVCTILYYGIFGLSISAVMDIFRDSALLHAACTIGNYFGSSAGLLKKIAFVANVDLIPHF